MQSARMPGGMQMHACQLPAPVYRRSPVARLAAARKEFPQAGGKRGAEWQQQCASVLLSALVASSTLWAAAPAGADSQTDRRANELEKRRQLLASTRERALAKGGILQQGAPTGIEGLPNLRAAEQGEGAAAPSAGEPGPFLGGQENQPPNAKDPPPAPAPTATSKPPSPTPAAPAPAPPAAATKAPEPKAIQAAKAEREKKPPLTQRQEGQSVSDLLKSSFGDYESMMQTKPKAGSAPTPAPAPAAPQKSGFLQRDTPKAEEPAAGPKFPNAKAERIAPPPPPAPSKPAPSKSMAPPTPPTPKLPEPPKPASKLASKPSVAAKPKGKVKGPLPMTLAQLIVLGIFGGLGYAFTAKAEASANFVQLAVDKLIEAYQVAEAALVKRGSKVIEEAGAEKRQPSGIDATEKTV